MSEPERRAARPCRTARFAALALVGGVTAGALGVYVIETRSGNEAAAGACAADDSYASAITDNAGGEVAAMVALPRTRVPS